ncbi:hypothetical protein [Acinetobacter courvalinii]|uniref:hypothetical protein n=1 Tax=Acinetobacter courvalinii TaxID=280147 RepID=UPI002897B3D9|nr:hypothetical protein [Acinetobacter courvalinii]
MDAEKKIFTLDIIYFFSKEVHSESIIKKIIKTGSYQELQDFLMKKKNNFILTGKASRNDYFFFSNACDEIFYDYTDRPFYLRCFKCVIALDLDPLSHFT